MRKITLVILLLTSLYAIEVQGQQDPGYTQYMYNMNIVNPAYAGSRGTLSIGVLG
ncbi:MAG: type IX secretion system membrane protein PorP/SprF, partial [Aureibaculum sp.]